MGSESTVSPNITSERPNQNPGSELIKPMKGDGPAAQGDITRETFPKNVFVNSEPMREDQVQNAVKFLSHSKVRDSPVMNKRSFLVMKGLTKEEIDEAFRRVPDPVPTVTTTQPANLNQEDQLKSNTNLQPQFMTQSLQPALTAPTDVLSPVTTSRQVQFYWSHAFLATGFLAASGAGTALLFKNVVLPRLKSWIRKVVLEEDESVKKNNSDPSLAEEAAAAAKSAAAAAAKSAAAAAACVAKTCQEMLNSKNEERTYFQALMNLLGVQVEEMKSMSNAIRKLEGMKEGFISSIKQTEEVKSTPWNVKPSSTPASMESSFAPNLNTYMEIMTMIQRGEKPPGIKEIKNSSPNPHQPPSNLRLAPRIKPWEIDQVQSGSYYREGSSSMIQDNRPTSQLIGESSVPWWLQKKARTAEIIHNDELKAAYSRASTKEQPVQNAWVPPRPPPIFMPEAAAAIQNLKPSIQKGQLGEVHYLQIDDHKNN